MIKFFVALFAALSLSLMSGCQNMGSGLVVPEVAGKPLIAKDIKTVADGYIVLASVRATIADAAQRKAVPATRVRELNEMADQARLNLDAGRKLTGGFADSKLAFATAILMALEAELQKGK